MSAKAAGRQRCGPMASRSPAGCRDGAVVGHAQEAEHRDPRRGHELRCGGRADAGAVFPQFGRMVRHTRAQYVRVVTRVLAHLLDPGR